MTTFDLSFREGDDDFRSFSLPRRKNKIDYDNFRLSNIDASIVIRLVLRPG
jgi:hypothetical protein